MSTCNLIIVLFTRPRRIIPRKWLRVTTHFSFVREPLVSWDLNILNTNISWNDSPLNSAGQEERASSQGKGSCWVEGWTAAGQRSSLLWLGSGDEVVLKDQYGAPKILGSTGGTAMLWLQWSIFRQLLYPTSDSLFSSSQPPDLSSSP